MEKILIEGGVPLKGSVKVFGAKNAALPILFSTILADGQSIIRNVPRLTDVTNTVLILRELGMNCERLSNGAIVVDTYDPEPITADHELVRKMRASVCALGPLLARRKRAKVSMPGGCPFGHRPIDLHLKGLEALGAKIQVEHGFIELEADRLTGAHIYLSGPCGSTVLGTANVMMAAALAKGTTVIECAACEPEISDLANFLNAMGAKISGIGTTRLEIEGVEELHAVDYHIIYDRIEAGTFMIAAAMTGGDVTIENAQPEHLVAVIDALQSMGVDICCEANWIRVRNGHRPKPVDITTHPYPGFPTDLQAQLMVYLCLADGVSIVTERIYPDRFMHVAELTRMGANIRKEGGSAIITGVEQLSGAPVMASDLRASACLILAGLVASGITEISEVFHLDRGYERIEDRLARLGAHIKREICHPALAI